MLEVRQNLMSYTVLDSYPLIMPLKHPISVMTDLKYEALINKIVTPPVSKLIRQKISGTVKKILGKDPSDPLFRKK